MRIVSYNILDGGIGRADPIAEVLLAQRPDIVGLVEAEDEEVVHRIAWRLGFDCVIGHGRRTGVLMSRWPIVETVNHPAAPRDGAYTGPRTFLEGRVETPAGEVTVCVIHNLPHATEADEDKRLPETEYLLEAMRPLREAGRPHVLIGDFNANHPDQTLIRDRLKPSSQKAWDANGGDLPRRVVGQILDAGYIDTLHHLRPDAARVAGTFITLHPGQRVDYVFTHGFAAVEEAWVETDRLATFASDHYPVGAQLRL